MVELLVAENDVVDHRDLQWLGHGKVKDYEGTATGGRRIRAHREGGMPTVDDPTRVA